MIYIAFVLNRYPDFLTKMQDYTDGFHTLCSVVGQSWLMEKSSMTRYNNIYINLDNDKDFCNGSNSKNATALLAKITVLM